MCWLFLMKLHSKLLGSIGLCHKIAKVSKKMSIKNLAIRRFPINSGRKAKNDEKEVDFSKETRKNTGGLQINKLPSAKHQKRPIVNNKLQVKRDSMPFKRSSFSKDARRTFDRIGKNHSHDKQRARVSELPQSQCRGATTVRSNPMNSLIRVNKEVNNGKEILNAAKTNLIVKRDADKVDISKETRKNTGGCQINKLPSAKHQKCPLINTILQVKRSSFSKDTRRTLDRIEKKGDAWQTIDTPPGCLEDGCQPNADAIDSKDEKILGNPSYKESSPLSKVVNPHWASIPGNRIAARKKTRRVFAIRAFPAGAGKNRNASIQDAESQRTKKLDAGEVVVGSSSEENKDEAQFRDTTTKEVVHCSSNNEEVQSSKPESPFATDEHKTALAFNNDKAQRSEEESQPTNKMQLEEVRDVKRRKRAKEDRFEIVALKKGKHDFLVSNANNEIVPTGGEELDARTKVMEILSLFRWIYDSLPQKGKSLPANHQLALKLLEEGIGRSTSNQRFVGNVPGVEIGDEFRLRVEMFIIGLHRQPEAGIDYIKHNGKDVAISIVSSGSGQYSNERSNPDVLLYSGSGVSHEDQKLKRGNLALKNSIEAEIPIRVIHGIVKYKPRRGKIYVYDGLYIAEKYWKRKSDEGHFVLMFQLRRIPGQPEVTIGKGQRCSTLFPLSNDSNGEEDMTIRAVNINDGDTPMPFKCTTKLIHPLSCIPTPLNSCDCASWCSDSKNCAYAVKTGGQIPINSSGAMMKAKPLVYEYGPSCKRPPTCHNRVSRPGIKFQLEICITESRGWAVRSPSFIPSGSFVCEYIGINYHDKALRKGLSRSIPVSRKGPFSELHNTGFAVDAFEYGNVGRFINHSRTPNLYAQNVLYDRDDIRMPRIMLFASGDIQPFEELTYDCNYAIDQVHDLNGNLRRKECHGGSQKRTKWLN